MLSITLLVIMTTLSFLRTTAFRKTISFRNAPVWRRRLSELHSTGEKYLYVPFNEKDLAKSLGARWDSAKKSWFIPEGTNPKPLERWRRVYLEVPFGDKEKVKSLGAVWDSEELKWFIIQSQDIGPFRNWLAGAQVVVKSDPAPKAPVAAPESKPFPVETETKTPTKAKKFTSLPTPPSPSTSSVVRNTNAPTMKSAKVENIKKPSDFAIILDLDTSGLPVKRGHEYAPYSALSNYDPSRIVQISYILCDKKTFQQLDYESFIIQSDGFPIDNSEYHGISKDMSLSRGVPFPHVAERLGVVLDNADTIISHNSEFDTNILKSELLRYGCLDTLRKLESKVEVCSMNETKDLVGLLNKVGGLKPPSMKELVKHTLDEEFPDQHNSQVCVQYLRRSLQKLNADNKFAL